MSRGPGPANYVQCPQCGGRMITTKNSRPHVLNGIAVVRRRRDCENCGGRATTYEIPEAMIEGMRRAIGKDMIARFLETL